MSNVVSLNFGKAKEPALIEPDDGKEAVIDFMGTVNDWCECMGIDTSTNEYRHQAAVIMTQLQIILMGNK